MRYVIGLTGGIACGKSNISSALASRVPVIDADGISRMLTSDGGRALPAIRQAFGDAVFDGDRLDRRALGQAVFADPGQLEKLNALMHPLIFDEMRRRLDGLDGLVVMDVPLLYETGLDKWCDEVWCVYLPQKTQIKRLRERDGITRKQALERIHAQMPALEKARRADRVIRTAGTREQSAAAALAYLDETLMKIADGGHS